jgi:hypothetical protein
MRLYSRISLVLLGLVIGTPATLRAGSVKVENYGNEEIAVAHAFEFGKLVSQGWTTIPSNQSKTFEFPNDRDAYLRIEHRGREFTFAHHQRFLNFPMTNSRFTASNEPDDNTVRTLRWGNNLEHSHNMRKGGALPNGWQNARYFHVGSENVRLEVKP